MPSLTTLLRGIPLLLLAAPTVLADGCYSGGQTAPYTGAVENAIERACDYLAGTYEPNESESACEDIGGGIRIDFAIDVSSQQATISKSDCITQNTYTANGCGGYGGIRDYGLFSLHFDPNTGEC